ncbi:universal stress protein [Thalassotalea sp. HSM 43]|uniref:universal stress protein n=1 Tax=Thalassotalea sp. HSM 43 TaxID=2552945 RepID=UPI00108210B6|nr:universal stress protein [Thalassotalea sp. HSM 43]QBY03736.1 universal stress protein [Thalassotalea sp. HSM 43]
MTILIAIDFSEVSNSVINALPDLVQIEDEIHILHVGEPNPEFVGFDVGPTSVKEQLDDEFEKQTLKLNQLTLTLVKQGYSVKTIHVTGVIVDEIVEYSQKIKAKMIILGRHGHSAIYNILVGSVAEAVLKRSAIPVLLVPK